MLIIKDYSTIQCIETYIFLCCIEVAYVYVGLIGYRWVSSFCFSEGFFP
jgi:hypothetical protein